MCEIFLERNVQQENWGEINLIKNDPPLVSYISASEFRIVYL
jgi:hypothetical protein